MELSQAACAEPERYITQRTIAVADQNRSGTEADTPDSTPVPYSLDTLANVMILYAEGREKEEKERGERRRKEGG